MKPTRTRSAKILNTIIDEIAKEEGLSAKKVDIILQSVFGLIAEDFRTQSCKGTRILNLGKFFVKPYKLQKYLDKLNTNGSNTENKR